MNEWAGQPAKDRVGMGYVRERTMYLYAFFLPRMIDTSFCPSMVPKNFRIKCPPYTRRKQAIPAGFRTSSLPPTLLLSRGKLQLSHFAPHSQTWFFRAHLDLSGDRDTCAHLVVLIIPTLEHLLGQPAWDSHQEAQTPAAFCSLHVPHNKSHFLCPHNSTQEEVTVNMQGPLVRPRDWKQCYSIIFPERSHWKIRNKFPSPSQETINTHTSLQGISTFLVLG